MTTELRSNVALVTGGSRGIGREVCIKLASLGCKVFVNFNSRADAAEETVAACKAAGGEAEVIGFSVAKVDDVERAIDSIKQRAGKLDILVNNAGISKDGLLVRMKDEDWIDTLATNLNGAFFCSRAAARIMMRSRYGRIINMSSVVAEMGNAGQVPYVSSKAGLIGLTKSMAKELGSRNITVNAITPGFIETEMTGGLGEETKQAYLETIPAGRFGAAREVAELCAFLAGPNSAYITGQIIGINGGLYM